MSMKYGVCWASFMAFALTTTTPVFAQGTAEVIHWWTSREAAALKVLVEAYQKTATPGRTTRGPAARRPA